MTIGVLQDYNCTPSGLEKFGGAASPDETDPAGVRFPDTELCRTAENR